MARGRVGMVRGLAIVFALLAVLLMAVVGLYASNISTGLSTVLPENKPGLQKAIAQTLTQGVLYPLAFLWVAIKGWKHASTGVKP